MYDDLKIFIFYYRIILSRSFDNHYHKGFLPKIYTLNLFSTKEWQFWKLNAQSLDCTISWIFSFHKLTVTMIPWLMISLVSLSSSPYPTSAGKRVFIKTLHSDNEQSRLIMSGMTVISLLLLLLLVCHKNDHLTQISAQS